jgi:hypothetical protein
MSNRPIRAQMLSQLFVSVRVKLVPVRRPPNGEVVLRHTRVGEVGRIIIVVPTKERYDLDSCSAFGTERSLSRVQLRFKNTSSGKQGA